jgi:hypothetical protein
MDPSDFSVRSIANYLFWLLVLQGIWFLLIGWLILVYPATLVLLAAATFFWIGVSVLISAWRMRRWRSVPLKPAHQR